MQGQSGFAGHKFAPLRGLEFQTQAECVAVEFHSVVHVSDELDYVSEFHGGDLRQEDDSAGVEEVQVIV